jgi:hypothetical protein
VIRATCDARFCLKRRLWSVGDLPPDAEAEKSRIPCLEPCAILLDFARKAMRSEQEEKVQLALAPAEIESLRAVVQRAMDLPDPALREADLSRADNPRRLKRLLEKLLAPVKAMPATE